MRDAAIEIGDRAQFEDGEGRTRVGVVVALDATLQLDPLQPGDTSEPPVTLDAALLTRRIPMEEIAAEARAQSAMLGAALAELRAKVAASTCEASSPSGSIVSSLVDIAEEAIALVPGAPVQLATEIGQLAKRLIGVVESMR